MVLFETIPSYIEAQAIQRVVEEWNQEQALPPIAVAFQCRSADQIADGTPVLKALEALKRCEANLFCWYQLYKANVCGSSFQISCRLQQGTWGEGVDLLILTAEKHGMLLQEVGIQQPDYLKKHSVV